MTLEPETSDSTHAVSNIRSLSANTRLYLAHTVHGQTLRSLAGEMGLHPSTVLRRVRRVEDLRDDPLLDEYLDQAATTQITELRKRRTGERMPLSPTPTKEETRILRRMCEAGTFLAISKTLEQGAVLRTVKGKEPTRIAVVDRELAKTLALNDWIKCSKSGAVTIYHVTEAGRAALRRAIMDKDVGGLTNEETPFTAQHRQMENRTIVQGNTRRKVRVNLRESPLTMLGRKKDSSGTPFLSRELVQAGERLREDFELSQMGPRITQNWDRFLTSGGGDSGFQSAGIGGSDAAAQRLSHALSTLGVGLGDIALRCCCYLEGLESAEKRMGWSARSGKIVLRIALQRLRRHYEEEYGTLSAKIG